MKSYRHVAFQFSYLMRGVRYYPDEIVVHERRPGQDVTRCGMAFSAATDGGRPDLVGREEKKNSELVMCRVCSRLCGMRRIDEDVLWANKEVNALSCQPKT
jgi:hypothetical protein